MRLAEATRNAIRDHLNRTPAVSDDQWQQIDEPVRMILLDMHTRLLRLEHAAVEDTAQSREFAPSIEITITDDLDIMYSYEVGREAYITSYLVVIPITLDAFGVCQAEPPRTYGRIVQDADGGYVCKIHSVLRRLGYADFEPGVYQFDYVEGSAGLYTLSERLRNV